MNKPRIVEDTHFMFNNYEKRIFELLFEAKIAQYNKNYIILT